MPIKRFVVQEHTTAQQGVHWDLMIERGPSLMTFRLDEPPEAIGLDPVRAVHIFDHDLRFLTYEGPVQKRTGRVRIVDRGPCRLETQNDDLLVLTLQGQTLNGLFELTRIQVDRWRLLRKPI